MAPKTNPNDVHNELLNRARAANGVAVDPGWTNDGEDYNKPLDDFSDDLDRARVVVGVATDPGWTP